MYRGGVLELNDLFMLSNIIRVTVFIFDRAFAACTHKVWTKMKAQAKM